MSDASARSIVASNASLIEVFIMQYLADVGIGVHLVEAVAKALFSQKVAVNDGTVPKELISAAVQDVVKVELFAEPTFDLQRVIEGAASLEFLVRYARLVDSRVFPPTVIPSDEVVNAALELFHSSKASAPASV